MISANLLHASSYILPIDGLLTLLGAHMFNLSGHGTGPRIRAQGAVGRAWGTQLLGPWALVLGPYPLWTTICASRVINRQHVIGDT